jgi:Tol biopolymer transport system component
MTSASDHAMAAAALTARATVITAVLFSTTACNEPIDVATGEIALTVITTGVDIDAHGYSVRVAPGSNRRIGPTETITLSRLLPGLYTLPRRASHALRGSRQRGRSVSAVPVGRHALSLDEVPPNCDAHDGFVRHVSVLSGDTIEVVFQLVCVQATPLAYVVPAADGAADIAIVTSNGTGERLLTTHHAWDGDPAWSPARSRIAFASERDGNREIYVMGEDGSDPVRLTHHSAHDHSPAWSPDGQRIVFVRDRTTDVIGGDLWTMNADGSNARRLTALAFDNDAFDADPVWSPDGAMIAFTRFERALNPAVYRMNDDGSGVTRLSPVGYLERNPAWSADGTRLALARQICAFGDYGCYDAIVITAVVGGWASHRVCGTRLRQLFPPMPAGRDPHHQG